MHVKIRTLSVCLSILLAAAAVLTSCGAGETVSGTAEASAPAETETQTDTEPLPEVKNMVLIDEGKPRFSLVVDCGEEKTENVRSEIIKTIAERYGCGPEENAEYSVSVKTVTKTGDTGDWTIEADGGKSLKITGCGTLGVNEALRYFFRTFTSGVGNTLAVPEDYKAAYSYKTDKIDNTPLLSYIPSDKVKLLDTTGNGKIMSPEWIESLVIVELRPLTASIGGRLNQSYDLIDFYAELGVNCIWLTPIYEYGPGGNGYGNTGVHRIGDNLTGTLNQDTGWAEMKKFVDHAHEKGVYILFDVITWGVMKGTELTKSHPDWFSGEAWGNAAFNWKNQEFREWFISTCVENIEKTGADGFRCDCEPNYSGYNVFGEVRERLAQKGKYVIIISEDGSNRSKTYDFEQDGVLWYARRDRGGVYSNPVVWYVDGGLDIVESVKKGKGLGSAELQTSAKKAGRAKYYTNCITNHDYQKRIVLGNRLKIGYAAITAPFIPLWYMGDEFNCKWQPAVQYDMTVNYEDAERPANRRFLEDVKRMITVRRTYKEIFEYWASDHRNANICAVPLDESRGLTAYARYAGNKAVLILPNNDESAPPYVKASVPFSECGIEGFASYRVTDLWTGNVICEGGAEQISKLNAYVPYEYFAMILIEGIG